VRPAVPQNEIRVAIGSEVDIVYARHKGRELALRLGFASSDGALIATAISELARNIVLYAGQGEIIVGAVERGDKQGIHIVAGDKGPGIRDIDLAMQDGYSTSGGLGVGLPGVRRLMDEFEIKSANGKGTVVSVRKWLSR
jgi:serine/threonine-protein kinase RsbT